MGSLLRVEGLKKFFQISGGTLHAVDDVSFELEESKTLGVVGESGCGKSTLGRTVLGLLQATAGEIYFNGENITNVKKAHRKQLQREMQIIFQDPFSSLDPRKSVRDLIAEPLKIHRIYKKAEMYKYVSELMDTVGLAQRFADSYPHELDGGRRQRIGIARALALKPKFVVCDEPVSALDVSIQAQILNLLKQLQQERSIAFMFITHDMSVVKHISHEIMVMYNGRVVEKCAAKELFRDPVHPYTAALLSAIPVPSIRQEKRRIVIKGEITTPIDPKPGCRFAVRCPYATEQCKTEEPVMTEISTGHFVSCHQVSTRRP